MKRLHVNVGVADLDQSIRFYSTLFGAEPSVRHDDYSDVGTATTGLASYRYDFATHWSVGAQASTAFRAPSFQELYISGAHFACFAVDCHENGAFDHGAALLVGMLVKRNHRARLDAHEVDHHVGPSRGPHGYPGERTQAWHRIDAAPYDRYRGFVVRHIDFLAVSSAFPASDCR